MSECKSIFDLRKKPKWPTFRKGFLNAIARERLDNYFIDMGANCVFHTWGSYLNKEGANGGCWGNIKKERVMVSFEVRRWVLHNCGKRKVLYLIGWIGEYGNGSIMHLSWQYPHCLDYKRSGMELEAFNFYMDIAKAIYGKQEAFDKDVTKFIVGATRILCVV